MTNLVVLLLSFTLVAANQVNLRQFAVGNNLFAADVYKELLKISDDNFLVCPFSAETVLALAQSGAKDETAQEIRSTLRLPNSTEEIDAFFKTLLPTLTHNQFYQLHAANKIYVKNNYEIKEGFKQVASEVYESEVENIEFSENTKAAEAINGWVKKQTANKIQDVIDPEKLNDKTVAILINALYFRGGWKKLFKPRLTKKKNFYQTVNKVVQVDMMSRTDYFGYYESAQLNAKFLEMPFKGGKVQMVVVLPNQKQGLAALESQIDEVFSAPKFDWKYVKVSLPKFKIESSIDFKQILLKLGVNKAFTQADFSGIAGEKGEIHISDVIQKTFINVNEDGVEAAAATAVHFHPKSLMNNYGDIKIFKANHPFLFYIKINNIVIFTGRVLSPI